MCHNENIQVFIRKLHGVASDLLNQTVDDLHLLFMQEIAK